MEAHLYADKLVFQLENGQNFDLSFDSIFLDCGLDHNKLCSLQDYRRKNSDFTLPSILQKELSSLKMFNELQCLVLTFGEDKKGFICEKDQNNVKEFFKLQSRLSRLIDNYQIKMFTNNVQTLENHLKSDIFNVLNGNQFALTELNLNMLTIKGNNFDFPLEKLSPIIPSETLESANEKKLLTQEEMVQVGQAAALSHVLYDEKSCIVLFSEQKTFLCLSSSQPSIAKRWVSLINNFREKMHLSKIVTMFAHLTKQTNIVLGADLHEFESLKQRLINLQAYQDNLCFNLKMVLKNSFKDKDCLVEKNRDLMDEIYMISRANRKVFENIEKSIKNEDFVENSQSLLSLIKKEKKKENIVFLDVTESEDANKPTETKLQKSALLKKKTMDKLQKNRVWHIASDERSKGDFKKSVENDPFVKYLGYIKDSVYNSYQSYEHKELS